MSLAATVISMLCVADFSCRVIMAREVTKERPVAGATCFVSSERPSLPGGRARSRTDGLRALVLNLTARWRCLGGPKACCSGGPTPESLRDVAWTSGLGERPSPRAGCRSRSCRTSQPLAEQAGGGSVSAPGDDLESHHFLNGTRVKAVICQWAPKRTEGVSARLPISEDRVDPGGGLCP